MKCNVTFVNVNGMVICDLGIEPDEATRYMGDFKEKSISGEMLVVRVLSAEERVYYIRNNQGEMKVDIL